MYRYPTPTPKSEQHSLELPVEPEEVLDTRPSSASNHPGFEALVNWKGLPAHDASREPMEQIQQQFPAFQLEDKVYL